MVIVHLFPRIFEHNALMIVFFLVFMQIQVDPDSGGHVCGAV